MSTLNVTVQDAKGNAQADALVRIYRDTPDGPVAAGSARTNSAGAAVSFTGLTDGEYRIYVDPISTKYMDQWYGGGNDLLSPTVTVTGTVNITFILQLPLDPAAAEDRPLPLFWKDTNTSTVLVLYPGQERAAIEDRQSPIYQHVLVGPFLSSAKATAA